MYEIDLGSKKITFRKWKVKDRKKFIELMSIHGDDIAESEVAKALVYNCIDKPDIALTQDELKYILFQIRKESLGDTFNFTYVCEECETRNKKELLLSEVITFTKSKYSTINVDDIEIEMGEIISKEYYDKAVSECKVLNEIFLVDFLYHIKKFNSNDTFTFAELLEYFGDLDIDVMDKIFDLWEEQKSKMNNIYTVSCEKCGHDEKYKFDEIPEFFPSTWFER
jgi:hypothetical protein